MSIIANIKPYPLLEWEGRGVAKQYDANFSPEGRGI